jgi:hypothetical protein
MQTVTSTPAFVNTTPKVIILMESPGWYYVAVENEDGLRIVSDLMPKAEAREMCSLVNYQLLLHRLAAAAQDNRMARAMAIVADGKVHKNGNGWTVDSQTDALRVYRVQDGHCDCADHVYRANTCKHMMAVELAERSGAYAELDSILNEVRSGAMPKWVVMDDELEAMPIGMDESIRPYAY